MLSRNSKMALEFYYIGQGVCKLWIKTVKMLFGSITQEPLGLSKFWSFFLVPCTICYKMLTIIFQKGVDNYEIQHKTC